MAVGPPAGASQLEARDRPTATGPLTYEGRRCTSVDRLRIRSELVAVGRSCIFLYRFSPTAEVDVVRDYGVAWVQTQLDARNGWCATSIRSRVTLPNDTEGHAHSTARHTTSKPRAIRPRLVADAGGAALSDGSLRQRMKLHPRRMRGLVSADGRTFTVTWSGRTARPLAFALGLEFSAQAADALLGDVGAFGGGLTGPLGFVKRRGC